MANVFPSTKTKTIVSEDGVSWANQIVTTSPLTFSNAEMSLTDSINDSYVTAVDDNDTQYLTVLESSQDETLEDINGLSLNDQKLIIEDDRDLNSETENNFISTESEPDVVIFNIEGSDEIYGIQTAQDEEGNVHRYQFQFRKTDSGQLEAMPETVQLLPNEEEQATSVETQEAVTELAENLENQILEEEFDNPVYLQEDIEHSATTSTLLVTNNAENSDVNLELVGNDNQENLSSEKTSESPTMTFIKGEQEELEEEEGDDVEQGAETDENYDDEEENDIKPGIEHINIKQEPLLDIQHRYLHQNENIIELNSHNERILENLNESSTSEAESYSTGNDNEETVIAYQQFDAHDIPDFEDTETLDGQHVIEEHYEQLLIEERNLDDIQYDETIDQDGLEHHEESGNILIVEKNQGSDTEDYEIVEGLPVTAEGEISEDTSSSIYQEPEILYTEPDNLAQVVPTKGKNVQNTTNILKQPTNVNKIDDPKKKTILWYMVPNTDQKENLNSLSNPRSLLKTNADIGKIINEENLKKMQREKLLERRYARSKEAIQAKMFNNFINKTTIPHAPIRQTRLPRKQEIKPMDNRRNEEIIVQEVMVSSKGFVESVSERLKSLDKLEITSIVELSDSDEDYDPKNGTKKKKKHKKTTPTNGDSSDESVISIIEILPSDDEPDNIDNTKTDHDRHKEDEDKRIRRHSKSGDESSPNKKSRTESSDDNSDNEKKEISCPHCPKTFPSQNSLNTHIQHHNLENSLHTSKKSVIEYKHKCDNCQETFKNSILLKRHICKTPTKHKCGVCFKLFKDLVTLNNHKKTHIKENLIKSTRTVTISPKKFLPRPSTSLFKAPAKVRSFKCSECSQTCSNQNMLLIHEKSHKKFTCTSCNMAFSNKLLLDTHVTTKCVKTNPTKAKRTSFTIRKSFVHTPPRMSLRRSINPVNTRTVASSSKVSLTASKASLNASKASLNASTLSRPLNPLLSRSFNLGLNTNNMVRTLEIEAQCDSCPMKFSTLTALFKHKVKNHGLSTPDKRVLQPERKTLHRPREVHGGIRTHPRLNAVFQEIRKAMIVADGEPDTTKKLNNNAVL